MNWHDIFYTWSSGILLFIGYACIIISYVIAKNLIINNDFTIYDNKFCIYRLLNFILISCLKYFILFLISSEAFSVILNLFSISPNKIIDLQKTFYVVLLQFFMFATLCHILYCALKSYVYNLNWITESD